MKENKRFRNKTKTQEMHIIAKWAIQNDSLTLEKERKMVDWLYRGLTPL